MQNDTSFFTRTIVKLTRKSPNFIEAMLFLIIALSNPTHRVCQRDANGTVTTCKNETWDPNNAQIPCSFLPPEMCQCITHSFDKFASEFESGALPTDGCPNGHRNENVYGIAICHPNSGVYCIGEQYWINTTYPCFEDGGYSLLVAIFMSFLLGICGADRFYLGYYFLGFIKLFSLGGFLIWWAIDFILLILGQWGPISGGYSIFY